MEKIGVFICHCGSNIKATVDADAVIKEIRGITGVAFAAQYPYMCAKAGQSLIEAAIRDNSLDGIVVAACSPRMHEATFRKVAESAGLNPYMVEIANIREHCSWIHRDGGEATVKAVELTRAAIAKVRLNAPLFPEENSVVKRALVIGGGIAGIQAALDIAEAGFEVDLVETTPSIGGKMAQLDKTFPTLDCSACILTPKMVDCASHDKINILTYSQIEKIEGFVGNFTATIRKKARSVCMEKCTGCGDCWNKCPVKKIPDEFNTGLSNRTAIYIPFAQALPLVPAIDREHCIKFKTGKCGLCQTVCQPGAIDFELQDEFATEKYGAIVVATGFEVIELGKFGEFGYDNPDVITSMEFERITHGAGPTGGELVRLSDGRKPKSITFIQCVGSRDITERGKPYCSKICCMYTAKHSILIKDKYPDIDVNIFYIDMRTPGKAYDEFYRRSEEDFGVRYIKGQVGRVMDMGDHLAISGVDLLDNVKLELKTDMVILATAIQPATGIKPLASMLSASIDTNNFMTEAHAKLRPVESPTAGVFLAGAAQGPKDIPETVGQAGAAAAKVIGLLAKDILLSNPCTATVDINSCNGCSLCGLVCPYGAISYGPTKVDEFGYKTLERISHVNQALCLGCGACVVACPSGAMNLLGYTNLQLQAEVDALCLMNSDR
ncbi:MAG: CoB--CoM heterodisulfide reductase iron-sulfur subunit A family protein [Clostridiales bacterium]|jgi:heterodisulfide reductase subunit A|nr:CoB--CoM heterodisulfide reductase iron-sulfur subunit A family protein [Clostridiales bacterium]